LSEENKIDVRCSNCGNLLFVKTVTGNSKEREYGGIEIPCRKCGITNVIGTVKKMEPVPPVGRITYRTKA
jgi:hypothetical protein